MKLEPREIIQTCSSNYQTWKKETLLAKSPEETKKFLEKAFFWLELQSNLLVLWTVQNTMSDDLNVQEKVEKAQININKKIVDYASGVIEELR